MLLYSGWTFIAFALLAVGKYGQRQSQLERQYQGRTVGAQKDNQGLVVTVDSEELNSVIQESLRGQRRFSSADDTVISLKPLMLIFLAVACFAAVMLRRERRKLKGAGAAPGAATGNAPA